MEGNRVVEAPTLGAYVCDLHPGSVCVCCGAALQSMKSGGASCTMGLSPPYPEESRILTCPVCGCEIAVFSCDQPSAKAGQDLIRAA